jgi:hypothetical protein
MTKMRRILWLCLLTLLWSTASWSQQTNLNVALMQNTFLVFGTGKTLGSITSGTAFLLLRPFSAAKQEGQSLTGKAVLVTAAHVFEEMGGDEAHILLRVHQNATDLWTQQPAHFSIRRSGAPLWKKLQDVDVAVMYVKWPLAALELVATDVLADDALLKRADVEPGAEMKILGYPLNSTSNDAGFPILRTGVIASYPLLPTSTTKTFLLDFRVFKGNSGGPVYYAESVPRGTGMVCCPPQFVMGIVSKEKFVDMPYSQLQLSLAEIIHASAIRAAIELLPASETREADASLVTVELDTPQAQH